MIKKRKICFLITSFIHYSRNIFILDELLKRDNAELHIIIGGSAVLSNYSSRLFRVKEILTKDGFNNLHEAYFNLEGDSGLTKAKTAGLAMIELASIFEKIKPDVLVVRGDRFEVLSAAAAASYMNIPIAHIEGGDLSGSVDESVRHAITKLAQIHFTTNNFSRARVIQMGERPEYVFNFGSPDVEMVHKITNSIGDQAGDYALTELIGSGAEIDPSKNFLMAMYHPVTTEIGKLAQNTRNLLGAIHELGFPTLWFWPNFDAGSEEIAREMRIFHDHVPGHKIRFMRYLPPRIFLSLLKRAKCFVGNSSAGIKECSYLGTPVVNIGTRQNRRLVSKNVVNADDDKSSIKRAIKKQFTAGRYRPSSLYYREETSKKIADKLINVKLYVQKSFWSNDKNEKNIKV